LRILIVEDDALQDGQSAWRVLTAKTFAALVLDLGWAPR